MTQDVDTVIGHHVQVAATLLVPEVTTVAAHQAEPAVGVQGQRCKPADHVLHSRIHVPASFMASSRGCSRRPSARATALIPRRRACWAARSFTRARPRAEEK